MGLFGFGNRVNRAANGLSDSLRLNYASAQGWLSGGSVYDQLVRSVQTFAAGEILAAKISKRDFRAMHSAERRLADLAERGEDASRRFIDNPRKLDKISSRLLKDAAGSLADFAAKYAELIKEVHAMVLKEKQMLNLEDDYLLSVLAKITSAIEQNHVYFSKEVLSEARDALAQALRDQIISGREDGIEDGRLRQSGQVKLGWFSRMFGQGHAFGLAKRYAKKFRRNEMKEFSSNLATLNAELDSGRISPTTFGKLIVHVRSIRKSQEYLRQIAHDARVILSSARTLSDSVFTSTQRFFASFRMSPDINQALRELEHLKAAQAEAFHIVEQDRVDLNTLSIKLNYVYNQVGVYFTYIFRASENALAQARAVPAGGITPAFAGSIK